MLHRFKMGNINLILWYILFVFTSYYANAMNMSKVISNLLLTSNYDERVRPNFYGGPVDVAVAFEVIATDDVDLTNMDYTVEFYLVQNWYDRRLEHSYDGEVVLEPELHSKVWLPDTFIVNAKSSMFHKVTNDNRIIKIKRDGLMQFRVRLSIRASCPVDLRLFPWDIQLCPLVIQSYGHATNDVRYTWQIKGTDGSSFADAVGEMAQYILQSVSLESEESVYAIGNYSTLRAIFHFQRMSGFYLIQTIGPSCIIVVISWMSFIIQPEKHPARVGVGVTSVLTMAAIQTSINSSLPKVSYIKIIDVYSIACYLFVYLALVEYALVLMVIERSTKYKKQKEKDEKNPPPPDLPWYREVSRLSNLLCNLRCCCMKVTDKSARQIDESARVAFPFGFLMFNAVYWSIIRIPSALEMFISVDQ